MAKVLITGGEGNLARALAVTNTSNEVILKSKKDLDIAYPIDTDLLGTVDIIIHAAALTRPMSHHVDNPWKSIRTNILGTTHLALACSLYQTKLVYISTDYVYPGTTGMYKESDPILPVNFYGISKYGGECSVQLVPNSLIVRCGFSETPFPHSYAFTDVHKSSLSIKEAASKIWNLIDLRATGIYNIGGVRRTIFDFAIESNPKVLPLSRKDINEPVAIDCSMDTTKYDKFIEQETT